MIKTERFKKVEVTSAQELRIWLEVNGGKEASVWLVTYKKHIPSKYVSVGEVLDELLCFGWVDGIRRKLDDDRTMQLISPRKAHHWAKTYKDRAARLKEEGRMQPAGLASIAASQRAGLWELMDDVDALIRPPDLIDALDSCKAAGANFDASSRSYQRNILRWIKLARTPDTRAKRIGEVVSFAARNQKIKQM
ncbi:MAG: YdeI/OmpD-associated family protein [Myxococcota bacterium]